MNTQKIGLIGLGAMGRGVAANLLAKNFEVIGYDVRPEMEDWMNQQGGSFVKELKDLAKQCQTVICFVVNDSQTEEVLFGKNGLANSLKPGNVFIACSTLPPAYVNALGKRLAEQGVELIDSPVTGGAAGAAKGSLTIISAGKNKVYEQIKPVLEAFGSKLFFVGERHGSGSQLKVINQLLCGVHLAAAGEALALADRQGLPLDVTQQVLCSGSAFSWMLNDRGPRMSGEKFSDVTSAVDIFVKDLGLVLDTAKGAKFSAPLASAAFNALLDVSGRGMGTWDDSAVICHYNRLPSTSPISSHPEKG
jgi:L-threonate 2-dehydrogenase